MKPDVYKREAAVFVKNLEDRLLPRHGPWNTAAILNEIEHILRNKRRAR